MDNGAQKKVVEPYLVDSLSFSESEERTIEHVRTFIDGEFMVKAIKMTNIAEVFDGEEGQPFYKVRIDFIELNERTGTERRTTHIILLQSPVMEKVLPILKERMQGTMSDYEVVSVQKTDIKGVIRYRNS
jgi:hypothetical protein